MPFNTGQRWKKEIHRSHCEYLKIMVEMTKRFKSKWWEKIFWKHLYWVATRSWPNILKWGFLWLYRGGCAKCKGGIFGIPSTFASHPASLAETHLCCLCTITKEFRWWIGRQYKLTFSSNADTKCRSWHWFVFKASWELPTPIVVSILCATVLSDLAHQ